MMIMSESDASDVLAPLGRADAKELDNLHVKLGEAADAEGLLDVAYRTLDTPLGTLLLAATARGLVRVAFEREDYDRVLARLVERLGPRILSAPKRLDAAARQLNEYFAGDRRTFDLPLDFSLSNGFRRNVLAHLRNIAYGHTESYTQVAAAVGSPKAVRAAGSACATNPLPVVVPCHRVVRSDGSVGGYVGGPEVKRSLLKFEAA